MDNYLKSTPGYTYGKLFCAVISFNSLFDILEVKTYATGQRIISAIHGKRDKELLGGERTN